MRVSDNDGRMQQQPLSASAAKPLRARDEPEAPSASSGQALRQACEQFEAVFLAQLLQKMRDTVPEDPLLGDSRAKDIYYSMLDWDMAQQIARTQSVGLAAMLYRQLSSHAGDTEPQGADKPPVEGPQAAVLRPLERK
jgi:flagellar protein FlgJ